jgi:hypothetical protein
VSKRPPGPGAMTGATGDLTPDEEQRDFEPGELREVSDPAHHADVTRVQATHAPEHHDTRGTEGADREPRIGGDEAQDSEDHF